MKSRYDRRALRAWLCAMPGVLLSSLAAAAAAPDATQQDLNAIRGAHSTVQSLSMTVQSREVREDELRRMKHNADMALQMSRIRVFFTAPDRLRLEGKRGILPVTLVM